MRVPQLSIRRSALRLALVGMALPLVGVAPGPARAEILPTVVVWKDPGCGGCRVWIRHMRDAGFSVYVGDTTNMAAVKQAWNVPDALQSCHTAVVSGGYVVEGHVPAADINRLIAEQPSAKGWPCPACRSPHPAWTSQGSHTPSSCSVRQVGTKSMRSTDIDVSGRIGRRTFAENVSSGRKQRRRSDA